MGNDILYKTFTLKYNENLFNNISFICLAGLSCAATKLTHISILIKQVFGLAVILLYKSNNLLY